MTEYRVMEPIDGDRGGFGRVFRAIRVTDGVAVAIKVLRDTASDYARQAFDREVKLLRELSHANIVQFVDEGSRDGSPFYAMELMSGPLTNWAGRLTDAQVRSALTEIAKGLAASSRRLRSPARTLTFAWTLNPSTLAQRSGELSPRAPPD